MAGSLIGGAISGIGSIISGNRQNRAIEQGNDAMVQAANIAAQNQRQGFTDTVALNQGRAQSGDAALAQMLGILGIQAPDSLTSGSAYDRILGGGSGGGGGALGGSGATSGRGSLSDFVNTNRPDIVNQFNTLGADDLEHLQSEGYGNDLESYARYLSSSSPGNNLQQQYSDWNQGNTYVDQPGYGTGGDTSGGNDISNGLFQPGGDPSSLTDLIKNQPGYQFRMQEGVNAIDSSAASGGRLLSGSALRRINEFGNEYAAREFDNYYNRLAGVAGTGQTNTQAISGAAQNNAANQANIQNNLGQNLASSYGRQTSGVGNALGFVGGGVTDYYSNRQQGAG